MLYMHCEVPCTYVRLWVARKKKNPSLCYLTFCPQTHFFYSYRHPLYFYIYPGHPLCYNLQPKGRAVSRLLESFAADEGFQMDGSSFSEGEEDSSHSPGNKSPQRKTTLWLLKQKTVEKMLIFYFFSCCFSSPWSVPNCVLSKQLLTDGLKVLVSKEDELMYAAKVQTLELPDM